MSYNGRMQVPTDMIATMPDLIFSNRDCTEYPYEVSTVINGIKLVSVLSVEDLEDYPEIMQSVYDKETIFNIHEDDDEYLPFADEDFLPWESEDHER